MRCSATLTLPIMRQSLSAEGSLSRDSCIRSSLYSPHSIRNRNARPFWLAMVYSSSPSPPIALGACRMAGKNSFTNASNFDFT